MNVLRRIGEAMDRMDERNIAEAIRQKQEELNDLLWQQKRIAHDNAKRAAKRRAS